MRHKANLTRRMSFNLSIISPTTELYSSVVIGRLKPKLWNGVSSAVGLGRFTCAFFASLCEAFLCEATSARPLTGESDDWRSTDLKASSARVASKNVR